MIPLMTSNISLKGELAWTQMTSSWLQQSMTCRSHPLTSTTCSPCESHFLEHLFLQGRTPLVRHLRSSGSSRGVAVAVYRDLRMHWVLRFKRLLFFARHLDGGECPMELRRQQSVYQIRAVVCSPSASQRLVCCRRIMRNQKLTNGGGTIGVRGVDESQE